MKRVLCLILCVAFTALLLCSCTGGKGNPSSSKQIESSVSSRDISALAEHTPQQIGRLKFAGMFYYPRESAYVYNVDISHLNREIVTMLRSLQGLVSREDKAQIYLSNGDSDSFWRDYCSSEYGVYFSDLTVEQLLEKFKSTINKIYIYEPKTYEYNAALNIAMQENALVATKEVVQSYDMDATAVTENISDLYSSEKQALTSILGSQDYTYNTAYLSCCDENSAFTDYIYATKTFCLGGDVTASWKRELACALLSGENAYAPAICMTHNALSAKDLKYLTGISCAEINFSGFANSTFLSSLRVKTEARVENTMKYSKPVAGNVYTSVCVGVNGVGDCLKTAAEIWSGTKHVTRISLEFSPVLYDLAPCVLNWYNLNSTTSDQLVCTDGGWAKIDVSAADDGFYSAWNTVNNYYMKHCALSVYGAEKLRIAALPSDPAESQTASVDSGAQPQKTTVADGILVKTDKMGSGSVNEDDIVPTVECTELASISDFYEWANNLVPGQDVSLYYCARINAADYMSKSGEGLSFDDIVSIVRKDKSGALNFTVMGNIFSLSSK